MSDMMRTRYSISLSPKDRKHQIITDFIKENASSDGRGIKLQSLVEDLLYECAISQLPMIHILLAIRNAGESSRRADKDASPDLARKTGPGAAQSKPQADAPPITTRAESAPEIGGDVQESHTSKASALARGVKDMLGDGSRS